MCFTSRNGLFFLPESKTPSTLMLIKKMGEKPKIFQLFKLQIFNQKFD